MIPIQGCCMPNRNQGEQWWFSFIRCDLLQQMRLFLPPLILTQRNITHVHGGQEEREVKRPH